MSKTPIPKENPKRPTLKLPLIPSKEQALMSSQNTDKVPAVIHSPSGVPQAPAALTHGEFVFSIPSIIAIGKGNYHKGLSLLKSVHLELKHEGEKLMGFKQGQASMSQQTGSLKDTLSH